MNVLWRQPLFWLVQNFGKFDDFEHANYFENSRGVFRKISVVCHNPLKLLSRSHMFFKNRIAVVTFLVKGPVHLVNV